MEFVLARAGYSASRRCFRIMLLRDHEKAPILSARQKISLGPGRLVGLLHIAARDLEGPRAPRPLALAEDAGLGDRPRDVARVGRPTRASRHGRTRRARPNRRAGPRPGRGADPRGRDRPRRGQPGAGDRAARAGRRALRRVPDPDLGSHHALLFDAAREGDRGQSRSRGKLERALDLAEPEGLILPLTIIPVQGVLERHPRHRTAHATFLSTILDVRRTRSARTCATSTPSSASTAEPRRSPAPERARAPRTIPPAPASASAVRTK